MDGSVKEKVSTSLRLGRAIRMAWGSGGSWTLANAILVIVQAGLPLLSLYLLKLVVDAVTAGVKSADPKAAFKEVLFLVAVAGAVALLSALLKSLASLVTEAQGLTVSDRMHDVLHAKSIEVDLGYYEDPRYHDTLHRAQAEAPYRPVSIVNNLTQLSQSGLSLAALTGLLVALHWAVAIVLFVAVVPGVLVRLRFAGRLYEWQRNATPAERMADYFHWVLTAGLHAKEIRIFGLGRLLLERFRDVRRELRRERIDLSMRRTVAEATTQVGSIIAIFGALGYLGFQTLQGSITLGDLVMYFQAFQRGQGFLQEVLHSLANLYEDNLFLGNLYEFLDLKPSVADPPKPEPVPIPLKQGVELRGVGFGYPGSDRMVLDGVTFKVGPGEVVALVGENGSGKTTLVKLLCRLYDPDQGVVSVDGTGLKSFKAVEWRKRIAVLFQDFGQYYLTARENIRFGNVDLAPDDGRVVEAARRSGADEVIRKLPSGYDTVLGKWFDHGQELSQGEWQKVALARAFVRDADLVILDEPTSSLDARAEAEVFEGFRKLMQGRSVILVSHRFSTVRMADRIYVLHDGKVAEEGSHDQLMALGGRYATLFDLQAKSYR